MSVAVRAYWHAGQVEEVVKASFPSQLILSSINNSRGETRRAGSRRLSRLMPYSLKGAEKRGWVQKFTRRSRGHMQTGIRVCVWRFGNLAVEPRLVISDQK